MLVCRDKKILWTADCCYIFMYTKMLVCESTMKANSCLELCVLVPELPIEKTFMLVDPPNRHLKWHNICIRKRLSSIEKGQNEKISKKVHSCYFKV